MTRLVLLTCLLGLAACVETAAKPEVVAPPQVAVKPQSAVKRQGSADAASRRARELQAAEERYTRAQDEINAGLAGEPEVVVPAFGNATGAPGEPAVTPPVPVAPCISDGCPGLPTVP